ncbi:MAG: hypothetical protein K2J18_05050 [Paramuribaculum sp.]|nr:hypothetical protein [Paramuribaculum sp.]
MRFKSSNIFPMLGRAFVLLVFISILASCRRPAGRVLSAYGDSMPGWELDLYPDSMVTRERRTGKLLTLTVTASDSLRVCEISNHHPELECGSPLIAETFRIAACRFVAESDDVPYDPGGRYSPETIFLAAASLDPHGSRRSLEALVRDGRICSSDSSAVWPVTGNSRLMWAVAAWELYCVTADRDWLAYAFEVIDHTMAADIMVALDQEVMLLHGSSSTDPERILNSYPEWMNWCDIYQTMGIASNVLAERAAHFMTLMARELGRDPSQYEAMSSYLRCAINDHLWLPDRGYFAQYIYGGLFPIRSEIADSHGEALAVALGMASDGQSHLIVSNTPRSPYGLLMQFPLSPSSPLFMATPATEALWAIASSKVGNTGSLRASATSVLRSFLLMVSSSPEALSPELCSALYAVFVKAVAGISFDADGMRLSPVLPTGYKKFTIYGIRYGQAVYDIEIKGSGASVRRLTLDGVTLASRVIPRGMSGHHRISVQLDNSRNVSYSYSDEINVQAPVWAPPTPRIIGSGSASLLRVANYADSLSYEVFVNGSFLKDISNGSLPSIRARGFTSLMFVPTSPVGWSGYSCRPFCHFPAKSEVVVKPEEFAEPVSFMRSIRADHDSLVELSTEVNTRLALTAEVKEEGDYMISVRYAPSVLGGQAALRTLFVNGLRCGVVVMPAISAQKTLTGLYYSNPLRAHLRKGLNTVSLDYITPYNVNPDDSRNIALIDRLTLIKL